MRGLRQCLPLVLALFLGFFTTSCGFLYKTRIITRHGKAVTASTQTLLSATREQLEERISKMYAAISSFQASVDLTPSIGSVYKGQITEIKDVRAYVLFRKRADIRIVALNPVVRSKAFDMVSNGRDFRFYLTSKNLFVEGANDAPAVSKNKIENLRPDAFLSSMLVRPADPVNESAYLTDLTDEENALYILHFFHKSPNGDIEPSREIWFDRLDLTIIRQIVQRPADGGIVSDTRYSKWQPYGDAVFPAHIDINRPIEGYGVVLDVMEMQMNKSLTNEQFVLTQPAGTQLQVIGGGPREGDTGQANH